MPTGSAAWSLSCSWGGAAHVGGIPVWDGGMWRSRSRSPRGRPSSAIAAAAEPTNPDDCAVLALPCSLIVPRTQRSPSLTAIVRLPI